MKLPKNPFHPGEILLEEFLNFKVDLLHERKLLATPFSQLLIDFQILDCLVQLSGIFIELSQQC